LKDKRAEREWVLPKNDCWETLLFYDGDNLSLAQKKSFDHIQVECIKDADNITTPPSLHTIVTIKHLCAGIKTKKHIIIYPEIAAFNIFLEIEGERALGNLAYSHVDRFAHSLKTGRFTAVEIKTGTDYTNDLISEKEGSISKDKKDIFQIKGNILFLEDKLGNGVFFYKESPVSLSLSVSTRWDFYLDFQQVSMIGLGFNEANPNISRTSYSLGLGVYSGGKDYRLAALREYQMYRYRIKPDEGYATLSNDWGTSSRLDEKKVISDMETASQIGISQHTMDAGWCKFWDEIDRQAFPGGFIHLKKISEKTKVSMGLWMMPMLSEKGSLPAKHPSWVAKTNDNIPCEELTFEIWGKKKTLYSLDLCHPECFKWKKKFFLKMFRKFGIKFFKLDFSQLNLYQSEYGDFYDHYQSYERLIREVKEEEPCIWFSFDATRRNRPVYHFALKYGSVFLENRYRNLNYKPYKTLASLWQMASYIPPQRIEIEICPGEPKYSSSYLFATAMFAIPLFWGFLFKIPESSKKEFASIIRLYSEHYINIRKGIILPLGKKPNGKSWTGFQSHNFKENSGYLLIFREDNPFKENSFKLRYIEGEKIKFISLLKKGEVVLKSQFEQKVKFILPKKRTFNLYYYELDFAK